MIVKVIIADPETWYSGCLNDSFHVFQQQNNPLLFFSRHLFFYPEHVQIQKVFTEEPFIPQIDQVGRS